MASSVLALRELLQRQFPGATPLHTDGAAEPLATGIPELDALLPGGGLPRGRLTLWRPGGGATAVLRAACRAAVERSERAAWIDAAGVACGDFGSEGVALLRPQGMLGALECAEELLRSSGFALVVLAAEPGAALGVGPRFGGAGPARADSGGAGAGHGLGAATAGGSDATLVRLSRVAREGGGGLVVVAARSPVAGLRITTVVHIRDYYWRNGPFGEPAEVDAVVIGVRATTPGWSGETVIRVPVAGPESRLALDAAMVDRRGVPEREQRRRAGARTGSVPATGWAAARSSRAVSLKEGGP